MTFHVANKKRERNQTKLQDNLENLRLFMNTNKLTINRDKTHILEVMIQQKRAKTPGNPPELRTENNRQEPETIRYSGHLRILGINIQDNLTFKSHLETGKKSLLPSLRKNLGHLKSLGRMVPQGSRNVLARGFINSRLTYLISVWGGATENLLRKAQILQNSAARWVTATGKRTRVTKLLELTGWLNVKEMTTQNSMTLMWKILYMEIPSRLSRRLDYDRSSMKLRTMETRLQFTKQNFLHRASLEWNKLPDELRLNGNLGSFKKQLKNWIKSRRPPDPDGAAVMDGDPGPANRLANDH